ncbi:Permease of the drug/metabolite transporter (DMT) superfamily [Marinobacterium lacunae]|uniref:Permease of the drug/metabolite transporter (DMT) superfamily n=1 Tax=Marinobacterium lacunae TaxID=1232683 RepID=A0A081FXY2_9GAMM|nr:EamA family transporter [Marinobacterium lacunae]KEA63387.1 Permease of the drug/metabolite transporter (DMT) superfamily [Marinobacterium lacunae]
MNAVLYMLTVLIWGTTWIAISLQEGIVAPVVSVFYRFAVAAILLFPLLILCKRLRPLDRRDHLFCMLQGMCVFGLNFYCFYTAVSYISSGLESVIFSIAVIFNALNAVVFLRQPVTAKLLCAALLGVAGMVSLFWNDLVKDVGNSDTLLGAGLCLLGTYGFSLGNMISARHQKRGRDVMTTNAWAMGYGALFMAALATLSGAEFTIEMTPSYLISLFYLSVIGSLVGFGAYFALIGRIGTGPAAYATVLFPLVALSISTVFEGYVWTPGGFLGLGLILLGNIVMFARWPKVRFLAQRYQ